MEVSSKGKECKEGKLIGFFLFAYQLVTMRAMESF
jgi:hypothetical protein